MENPQERVAAIRAPIEKLGGKIDTSFLPSAPLTSRLSPNFRATSPPCPFPLLSPPAVPGQRPDQASSYRRSSRRSLAQIRPLRLSLDYRPLRLRRFGRQVACSRTAPLGPLISRHTLGWQPPRLFLARSAFRAEAMMSLAAPPVPIHRVTTHQYYSSLHRFYLTTNRPRPILAKSFRSGLPGKSF